MNAHESRLARIKTTFADHPVTCLRCLAPIPAWAMHMTIAGDPVHLECATDTERTTP